MQQKSQVRNNLAMYATATLLASTVLAPMAEAKLGDPKDPKWKRPEKPAITSPAANSQLPHASRIDIKGTGLTKPRVGGWRFHTISGKITATYLPENGNKRVRDDGWGRVKGFTAVTDKNGVWLKKGAELPTLKEGWKDVRYEISVVQTAREERDDHPTEEVNPLTSEALVIEVSPLAQPPAKEVAPAMPQILQPQANSRLSSTSSVRLNGQGVSGNTIEGQIVAIHYNTSGSTRFTAGRTTFRTTVGQNNQWTTTASLPSIQSSWNDPRYVIEAIQISKNDSRLRSAATKHEVLPPPGSAGSGGNQTGSANAAIPQRDLRLPRGAEIKKDNLLALKITTPANRERVNSPLVVRGVANKGSKVRVNVKRKWSTRPRAGGKQAPKRSQDLGTFTANVNSKSEWSTTPIHLTMPSEKDPREVEFEIVATEIYSNGRESSPVKVTVFPK